MKHCVTSPEVAGSILDGVIEIFQRYNPASRAMTLGSIQSDGNEYQEYLLGVKAAGP